MLRLSEDRKYVMDPDSLTQLLHILQEEKHEIIGPIIQDGAIVYDEINSTSDLPIGWTSSSEGGTYRLEKLNNDAFFSYVVGPYSWKKFLLPSIKTLFRCRYDLERRQLQTIKEPTEALKYAFVGVRPCDLHAIAIQNKVLLQGESVDTFYKERFENIFVVAVNCGQAGGTCFCTSMGTGPKAKFGFDIALTEVLDARHYFVVEAGTERGMQLLKNVPHREASKEEEEIAQHIVEMAAAKMGRTMDTTDIKGLLYRNYEHPRFDHVASRCLTCGNCTMVCPTCFCTTVEDTTDLTGENVGRLRKWDSCFTMNFSYIHGGSIRASTKSRYRQWITHKLATWIDQFGISGCVGCGRCITWCPVAIDITEEVRVIREAEIGRG